jgi:RNA polymerase sigma-32 factor
MGLDSVKTAPYFLAMAHVLAPAGDSIDRYMAEIKQYPLLDREAELQLARRYARDGDVRAAHQLVVSNLRFVVKVAHEYRGYGLKLLDLIQEGNLGLMVAIKKFDPEKGYRLISYAVWWIRAGIQSFIMRSWSLVRLGATRMQRKLFFKLRSERARAQAEKGGVAEPISSYELAQRLEVGEADILDMEMRLALRDFSLDAPLDDAAGSSTHIDRLEEAAPSAETLLVAEQQKQLVQGTLRDVTPNLNEKERYIVQHRLMADEPRTLQEIGTTFNVSRERVRQLETRVLSKLRTALAPVTQGAEA